MAVIPSSPILFPYILPILVMRNLIKLVNKIDMYLILSMEVFVSNTSARNIAVADVKLFLFKLYNTVIYIQSFILYHEFLPKGF
jgi:hypothetical protein